MSPTETLATLFARLLHDEPVGRRLGVTDSFAVELRELLATTSAWLALVVSHLNAGAAGALAPVTPR